MTFQEAHKNDTSLVTRRNLTETALRSRLKNYFSTDIIDEMIKSIIALDCWTNGEFAITSTYENDEIRFIVIANEKNYMKLVEP